MNGPTPPPCDCLSFQVGSSDLNARCARCRQAQRIAPPGILSIHARAIVATALIFLALPLCWHSPLLLIAWLVAFAAYLGTVLIGVLTLEPTKPVEPPAVDAFRFVGASEQKHRGGDL